MTIYYNIQKYKPQSIVVNIFFFLSFHRNFVLRTSPFKYTAFLHAIIIFIIIILFDAACTYRYDTYIYTNYGARGMRVCKYYYHNIHRASARLEWTKTGFVHHDFIVLKIENKLYINLCTYVSVRYIVLVYWYDTEKKKYSHRVYYIRKAILIQFFCLRISCTVPI